MANSSVPAPNHDRLCGIELLLLWEGRLTSARYRELFPVHVTQASRDFSAYRDIAPDNIQRAWGTKSYAPGPFAKPVLTGGFFAEYAHLVGLANAGRRVTQVPVEDIAPAHTLIKPEHFRVLHQAMANGTGVQIDYASLSNPRLHSRTIFPHALIHAGTRWHVRAWCVMRQDYRDFNLSRIRGADAAAQAAPPPGPDEAWEMIVPLRLIAHTSLSVAQQKVVREEFFRGTTALVLDCRAALLPYVVQAYGAAMDPVAQTPPQYLLEVDCPERLPPEALRMR